VLALVLIALSLACAAAFALFGESGDVRGVAGSLGVVGGGIGAEPNNDGYAVQRASLDGRLGGVLIAGRPKEAEAAFRAAIADLTPRLRESRCDAALAQELGSACTNLAVFLRTQGRADDAEKASAEAVRLFAGLVTSTDDRPDLRAQLALAERELGVTEEFAGQPLRALEPLKASRDRLAQLVREFPGQPELRQMQGRTLAELGHVARLAQDANLTRDSFTAAVDVLNRLAGSQADNPAVPKDLAFALDEFGQFEALGRNYARAERLFAKAVRIQRDLVRARPQPPTAPLDAARALRNLGVVQTYEERFADAAGSFRESADLLEGLLKQSPDSAVYRQDLLQSLTRLADLYRDRLHQPRQEAAVRRRIDALKQPAAPAWAADAR
jgi:hypothetical protein